MLTNQIYKPEQRGNNMTKNIKKIFILLAIDLLITLLLFLGASSFVSAADISISRVAYDYKQGSVIDIMNPCYYNGANCPVGTNCSITVYDPDNQVIVNNQPMTYGASFFNYTLPYANYSIGSYKCDMVCTYSGTSGSQRFYLDIGTGGSQSLFIILSIASIVLLILAILLKNNYIGFIASTLFILTGLYVLIYGVGNFLSDMYTTGIGWIFLGLGILFMIAAAYAAIAEGGLFYSEESDNDSLYSDTWGRP
jgi:hypothetical protein